MSKKSLNKQIGHLGETITSAYLEQQGYVIIERNYQKPWVEIDVIAVKDNTIHFVEVKTASFASRRDLEESKQSGYRLEDLIHEHKLRQLRKGVETWLVDHPDAADVQIDAAMVKVVPSKRYAQVKVIERVG